MCVTAKEAGGSFQTQYPGQTEQMISAGLHNNSQETDYRQCLDRAGAVQATGSSVQCAGGHCSNMDDVYVLPSSPPLSVARQESDVCPSALSCSAVFVPSLQ